MAKLSTIYRNKKRQKLAVKFKQIRDELRAKQADPRLTPEERFEAGLKLQKLPRDSSFTRVRRRCECKVSEKRECGRPRAVTRLTRLCRSHMRNTALIGNIPGMHKASW